MNTTSPFINGMALNAAFYEEAVKPILAERFPRLVYSAARLGNGSEVLGYDTPRSMDHHWGPRVELFLREADAEQYSEEIVRVLSEVLPYEVHGYPAHFAETEDGSGVMARIESGPVKHGVTLHTLRSFFTHYLGRDPRDGLTPADWLVFPEQRLRTIASGRVFHDGLGELEPIRAMLDYYPRDVWLYLVAAQWRRIDQEEPFMGRCGEAGDELGSRVVAARLIREIMKLCFLMERQYAPYSKWFGTAFSQLTCAETFLSIFGRVLNAETWPEREMHLSAAYIAAAEQHNRLGLTPSLSAQVSSFYSRPFLVLHSSRFVDALRAAIRDEAVLRLPPYVGSVDQFVDSVDVLTDAEKLGCLRAIYEPASVV